MFRLRARTINFVDIALATGMGGMDIKSNRHGFGELSLLPFVVLRAVIEYESL
jgi:hypothetical protein